MAEKGPIEDTHRLVSIHILEILNKYNFDYQKYSNLSSLIFDIDNYLNDNEESLIDLEEVLILSLIHI